MKPKKTTGKAARGGAAEPTWPPEVVRQLRQLDEEMAAAIAPIHARAATAEGKGWVRLFELLKAAAADPVVSASRPAADFLTLVIELAGDGLWATDGAEPFHRIDGLLPKGALGERSIRAHKAAAAAPRKLQATERAALVKAYKALIANDDKRGARKVLARRFDVSVTTVDNVLKKAGAKRTHK